MKKFIIIVSLLLMPVFVFAAAPDRRISDEDAHVLNVNSDGSIPITLSGDLTIGSADLTTTGTIATTGTIFSVWSTLITTGTETVSIHIMDVPIKGYIGFYIDDTLVSTIAHDGTYNDSP